MYTFKTVFTILNKVERLPAYTSNKLVERVKAMPSHAWKIKTYL